MDLEKYVGLLHGRYLSNGLSREKIRLMFRLAMGQGFSVKESYLLIKTGLSQKYRITEIYSLADVLSMTGTDPAAAVMDKYHDLYEILGLTGDT